MNGQTGKMMGDIPLDKKKAVIWWFAILGITFILCSLIWWIGGMV